MSEPCVNCEDIGIIHDDGTESDFELIQEATSGCGPCANCEDAGIEHDGGSLNEGTSRSEKNRLLKSKPIKSIKKKIIPRMKK